MRNCMGMENKFMDRLPSMTQQHAIHETIEVWTGMDVTVKWYIAQL